VDLSGWPHRRRIGCGGLKDTPVEND
jgi:hypothetical protein